MRNKLIKKQVNKEKQLIEMRKDKWMDWIVSETVKLTNGGGEVIWNVKEGSQRLKSMKSKMVESQKEWSRVRFKLKWVEVWATMR